jgi:predicted nucleic acid-binding protein
MESMAVAPGFARAIAGTGPWSADFSRWHVHVPAAEDVLGAIGIHQRTGISFWDAMIVRSAAEMGCTALYSEDLNPGQEYSGVRAENPFQPPDAGRA